MSNLKMLQEMEFGLEAITAVFIFTSELESLYAHPVVTSLLVKSEPPSYTHQSK